MQVSVETTTGLERRLTVAIPAEEVDTKVHEKLSEVAKTANINGFRTGKAPLRVISRHFGKEARQEVVQDIISDSYPQALEQENSNPAGHPDIEIGTLEAGKDLEYVATIEVFPEIVLGDFSTYELTRIQAEINEADIDQAIERLREQRADFVEVDRAAVEGDRVTIDFQGTRDGEKFAGGSDSDYPLLLGSGSMIPGFEEGILGMNKGEQRVLSLTFPQDYKSEELKGAAVDFSVTLHKIEEKILPDVDEAFMAHFGSDSLEQFRDQIRNNMERELKRTVKIKLKDHVMDKLLEHHSIDVPRALVRGQIEILRDNMVSRQFSHLVESDIPLSSLFSDDLFKKEAERQAALGLIVSEIIKTHEIKADPEEVRKIIDELATAYEKPEEIVNFYYGDQDRLAEVEGVVLEDNVVELILAEATIVDKTLSYEEAVKPER